MEQKWDRFQGIAAAIGLLILILDSSCALEGARLGLERCIKTVIPSLFPFFVLSMVLINSPWKNVPFPLGIIGKGLGIPDNAVFILIPSLLGGYPVGAKCVADLYHKQQIDRKNAERLLAFSSNVGPSFLFGMVSGFFPRISMIWLLWFIHLLSAVLTSAAIPFEKPVHQVNPLPQKPDDTSIIWSAAKSMCLVCCWVMLFCMILGFCETWFLWMLPEWMQTLFAGTLELTNGCFELSKISDIKLRFIICSCMLALGGICVLFQTASVTKGLPLECYIKGKLAQTMFSFLLSCTVMMEKGLYFAAWIPILLFLFRKKKKRYRNPEILPV